MGHSLAYTSIVVWNRKTKFMFAQNWAGGKKGKLLKIKMLNHRNRSTYFSTWHIV